MVLMVRRAGGDGLVVIGVVRLFGSNDWTRKRRRTRANRCSAPHPRTAAVVARDRRTPSAIAAIATQIKGVGVLLVIRVVKL
jgi:hypothetical protein